MVQLQNDAKKFENANLKIVGVSYDNVDVLKKFAKDKSIKFPLLSDEGSKVIRQLDLEFKKGLPHPGTIIIDKNCVVCAKLFKEGYVKRHNTEELLEAASKLGSPADSDSPASDAGGVDKRN